MERGRSTDRRGRGRQPLDCCVPAEPWPRSCVAHSTRAQCGARSRRGYQGGRTMASPSERTILVVEDEADVRSLVSDVLRHEGFEVEEAQDGAQALAVLEREPSPERTLSAVLLDVMLPRIDGVS